jgi:hypothetical protein
MAAHLAFNDLVRLTTSRVVSVTGTATATPVAGEPIASAATRPLRRSAAWTVAGGASGGTVRIRMESATISRTVRVIAALGLELPPAGVTSVNALIRTGTSTAATGVALAAANFARPYDSSRVPWNVVWTFDGSTGNGAELVIALAAGASGTVRVGRLWASESLRMAGGFDGGWSQTIDDTSVVQYGPQGRSPSVYEGDTVRRLSIPMQSLDESEVLGALGSSDRTLTDLQSILLHLGRGRDVIALQRDSSQLYLQRLPVYGLVERPPTQTHRAGPFFASDIEIGEIR